MTGVDVVRMSQRQNKECDQQRFFLEIIGHDAAVFKILAVNR